MFFHGTEEQLPFLLVRCGQVVVDEDGWLTQEVEIGILGNAPREVDQVPAVVDGNSQPVMVRTLEPEVALS